MAGQNYTIQPANPKAQTAPQTAFVALEQRLCDLREASNRNAERLREIVDKLYGPAPEAGNASGPREVANGGVASLNGRIDDLYAVDGTIASLIDRLSSVI